MVRSKIMIFDLLTIYLSLLDFVGPTGLAVWETPVIPELHLDGV